MDQMLVVFMLEIVILSQHIIILVKKILATLNFMPLEQSNNILHSNLLKV